MSFVHAGLAARAKGVRLRVEWHAKKATGTHLAVRVPALASRKLEHLVTLLLLEQQEDVPVRLARRAWRLVVHRHRAAAPHVACGTGAAEAREMSVVQRMAGCPATEPTPLRASVTSMCRYGPSSASMSKSTTVCFK